MKMHKQLTNSKHPIYSGTRARILYRTKQYSARQLSLMKQENIRVAIKARYSARKLKSAIYASCGYCFRNMHPFGYCNKCPLVKKLSCVCVDLPEWDAMRNARMRKTFAIAHKAWCKKLGLWKSDWS